MSKSTKIIKEGTKKLKKVITNPLSDSYNKIKETNAQMSRIRKEHRQDLECYENAYNELQKTLEDQIALKVNVFETLGVFCDVFEKIKSRPEINEIQNTGYEVPKVEFGEIKDMSHWGESFVDFTEKAQEWAKNQTGKIKVFAKKHPLILAVLLVYFAPHILVSGIAFGSIAPMVATEATMELFAVVPILVPRSLARIILERLIVKAPSVIYKIQADRAESEMNKSKEKAQKSIELIQQRNALLNEINATTEQLLEFLNIELSKLKIIVFDEEKTDWNLFSESEATLTENAALSSALLYELCKVDAINSQKENVSKTQELIYTSQRLLEKEN